MTEMTIRCAFFDDQVKSELPDMTGGINAGLSRIDPRLDASIEAHVRYHAGQERLRQHEMPLHLALIDVFWTRDARGGVDAAEDLLVPALARTDTVVVLTSSGDGALTDYLYNPARSRVRPHAVFHKDATKRAELMEGVLRAAFSAAGKRLNSLVVKIRWDEDEHTVKLNDVDRLCLEELACRICANATSVAMRPIAGGLSGALTILIQAEGTDERGNPAPQGYLLKAHRDAELLEVELAAHRVNVKKLPRGIFARPVLPDVLTFGGWAAVAFDEAAGKTASAVRHTNLVWESWPRLFSKATIKKIAQIAGDNTVGAPDGIIRSQGGALSGQRLDKFHAAVADLGVPDQTLNKLDVAAGNWFTGKPTPVAISHGDLHTRNVLIDEDGTVVWIDAASMVDKTHWASDMARFATWLAFELVQDHRLTAEQVAAGLGLLPEVSTPGVGMSELRTNIKVTLADYRTEFELRGRLADDTHWTDAVTAEIMRVVYSRETFDRRTRLTACDALALTR